VEFVLYLPLAADPGREGNRVASGVAGDQVDDLDSLLPFLRDRPAQLRVWAAPSNSIQAGASAALMVRRARRPWPVLTDETAGMRDQGSFFSCR
jgi:hypothetical protein